MKKPVSALVCMIISVSVALSAACYASAGAAAAEESNGVPILTVTTESGDGCSLEKSDGYVSAHLAVRDVDGSEWDEEIRFKVRGNTTALSWVEKKSFAFKFEKKRDVLGMGRGKKWVLLSNAFDPTLLRNALALETADELGLAYTSAYRFVELWLDGSFRGSYLLLEPVRQGADRVVLDLEGNEGLRDFLVEYSSEKAALDPSDFCFTAANHRFHVTEPDEPSERQLAYMTEIMSGVIQTLRTGTESEIGQRIDLPSFARYYLLNEYYKPFDFGVSSVFFYYKDGKLYAGPVWDYDLSMGNASEAYSARGRNAASPQGLFADKNLFQYLARKSWFLDAVRAEYEAHHDFFSRLHSDGGFLDGLRSAYGETIERNYAEAGWRISKWWINTERKPDHSYDDNYAFLKNWLSGRYAWFEAYLDTPSRNS